MPEPDSAKYRNIKIGKETAAWESEREECESQCAVQVGGRTGDGDGASWPISQKPATSSSRVLVTVVTKSPVGGNINSKGRAKLRHLKA